MTLLDNLCKVNKQQGGILHQFLNTLDRNFPDMVNAYHDYQRLGIEFPSKKSLEKLARQYHLMIDWN